MSPDVSQQATMKTSAAATKADIDKLLRQQSEFSRALHSQQQELTRQQEAAAKQNQVFSDTQQAHYQEFSQVLRDVRRGQQVANEQLQVLVEQVLAQGQELGRQRTLLESQGEVLQAQGKELKALNQEVKSQGQTLKSHGEEVKSHGEELKSLRQEVQSQGRTLESHGEELKSLRQEVQSQGQELKRQRELLELHSRELQAHGEELRELRAVTERHDKTIEFLVQEVKALRADLDRQRTENRDWHQEWHRVMGSHHKIMAEHTQLNSYLRGDLQLMNERLHALEQGYLRSQGEVNQAIADLRGEIARMSQRNVTTMLFVTTPLYALIAYLLATASRLFG